jgi:hypothetical protein
MGTKKEKQRKTGQNKFEIATKELMEIKNNGDNMG